MNNTKQQELGVLDFLAIFSVILQVSTYLNSLKEISNNQIMNEILEEKNNFLNKIIDNQEKILKQQEEILNMLSTLK